MSVDAPPSPTPREARPRAAGKQAGLAGWRWPRWIDPLFVAGVVVAGVVLRFTARSAMWLDEALTVNIARLPLGDIGPWLRHDGHPPLYYWLLHFWMELFGHSDVAVRSLSGVFGVATLPLAWIAGRRLAGRRGAVAALVLMAVSPFAVRYSTEARMYSLVMLLVLAGWLIGQDAVARPAWWRLVAVALVTAALLWSHYWALYLVAVVFAFVVLRAVREHRGGDRAARDRTVKVGAAMVVGGLLFIPWLPEFAYQAAHTGTPWARASVPTTVVATSIAEFGGGAGDKGFEALFGWLLVMAALLGLFGAALDRRRIELDLRGRPEARPLAAIVVGTLVVAVLAMYASNSAFATRYDAVWFPLLVLIGALGLTRFVGPALFRLAVVVLVVFGLAGSGYTSFAYHRTQARQAGNVIAANSRPGDVVLTCPDQIAPGLLRELPSGLRVDTYPALASGARVNWADYQQRVDAVAPQRFVARALAQAGPSHRVFLAWSDAYRTHKGKCEAVLGELAAKRPGQRSLLADDETAFEHYQVLEFPPVAKS